MGKWKRGYESRNEEVRKMMDGRRKVIGKPNRNSGKETKEKRKVQ